MKKEHKKAYLKPIISKIDIDNEISLVMISNPPGDPPDGSPIPPTNPTPDENPFK